MPFYSLNSARTSWQFVKQPSRNLFRIFTIILKDSDKRKNRLQSHPYLCVDGIVSPSKYNCINVNSHCGIQTDAWTVMQWMWAQSADGTQQSNMMSSCILTPSHLSWRPLMFVYFIASSLASATAAAIFPTIHCETELKHHRQTQTVWHKKRKQEWNQSDRGYITRLRHETTWHFMQPGETSKTLLCLCV